MKITCEIIKDLLPLYHDNLTSNDSTTMIEEHLVHCESCKDELQSMNKELPITNTQQNLKEADAVKSLSKKWKKGMLKSLLKGILLSILAIALFALIVYVFMDFKVVLKP